MKFQEEPGPRRLIATGLGSQIAAVLFFFAAELILFFWLGSHIRFERFFSFLLTYLLVGAALGIAAAAAAFVLLRAGKTVLPEALLVAVNVGVFQLFFGLLILNGSFLPAQPVFSVAGFLTGALVFCVSVSVSWIVYAVLKSRDGESSDWRSVNACGSVGFVFGISHAMVSKAAGGGGLSLLPGMGYTLLFMLLATVVVLLGGKSENLVRKLSFLRSGRQTLVAKSAVAAAVVVISFAGSRYRPLVTAQSQEQLRSAASGKPNIIFLVMDTVRQDQLSTYGCERETSPKLTEFSKTASVLDAYSPMSWTLASHASMVTGKYPTENGTGTAGSYHIDLRNETLAEILQKNGYSTAAVIANCGVLSGESGFQQGFDYYSARPRETTPRFRILATSLLEKFTRNSRVNNILFYQRAENINCDALDWLQKHDGRPFFLFINYMDAHDPYVPPPPYDRKWYKGEPPSGLGAGLWLDDLMKKIESGQGGYEKECRYLLSQYDGAIGYLDEQIGKFLEQLRRRGLFDNSLIIITSDHGESFAEHLIMHHPPVVYQEVLHVPLLIKPPAGEADARFQRQQPVSLVELFDLVLQYVRIPEGEIVGSGGLLADVSAPVFSEGHLSETNKLSGRLGSDLYSIIRNNYKLIYSSNGTYSLFNLAADPGEHHDLLRASLRPQEERLTSEMKEELAAHLKKISAASLVAKDLPPETREKIRGRLKALGYLQ